ncbi:hypothetical protein BC830DRAFT_462589 [Chytriomyces sp. MP71]|nr:hypothetical protein BC830DRAFT_462589 [Chytriomyces sp. MP71]
MKPSSVPPPHVDLAHAFDLHAPEETGVFEDVGALPKGRHATLMVGLTTDVVVGAATGLLVAPFVTIIDKSLTSNVSGRGSLSASLGDGLKTFAKNPVSFMTKPSFLAVFAVFAGTYITNNAVETVFLHQHLNPATPKFLIGSSANVGLNMWKDMLFTKWFATVAPKPLPRASYALFALRDTMTVSTSFVLPPIVSPYLQEEPIRMSKPTADFVSQLTLPCAVQLVSVPVHVLSLDLYNNPQSTMAQRTQLIRSSYWSCAFGRVLRTIPGFGMGGVVNRWGRHELNIYLNEKLNAFSPFFRKQKI